MEEENKEISNLNKLDELMSEIMKLIPKEVKVQGDDLLSYVKYKQIEIL